MNCRRHGTRPTVAFWMLVALADVALLVARFGVVALFAVLALVAIGVAGWRLVRRTAEAEQESRVTVARSVETPRRRL